MTISSPITSRYRHPTTTAGLHNQKIKCLPGDAPIEPPDSNAIESSFSKKPAKLSFLTSRRCSRLLRPLAARHPDKPRNRIGPTPDQPLHLWRVGSLKRL